MPPRSLREAGAGTGISAGVMALALSLAACGSGDTATAPTTVANVETTAPAAPAFPDFTVSTADGGQIEWSSLQGQDVVLWFWAPW